MLIGGPVSAQQIITVGVNMMDTVMLGQVNETALAASSMAVQIHTLFHFMSMGMGMGASVLIARYWGAQEMKSLKKTLTLMYRSCLLEALAFTLVVGLAPFLDPVLPAYRQRAENASLLFPSAERKMDQENTDGGMTCRGVCSLHSTVL